MEQILCEYAKDKSVGVNILLECNILNSSCGLYRYCNEIKKPTMTRTYLSHGCLIKDKYENKSGGVLLAETTQKKNKKPIEIVDEYIAPVSDEEINKTICTVNFSKVDKKKTSISYINNGAECSMFIDGIFEGKIEIQFKGKTLNDGKILKIKQV